MKKGGYMYLNHFAVDLKLTQHSQSAVLKYMCFKVKCLSPIIYLSTGLLCWPSAYFSKHLSRILAFYRPYLECSLWISPHISRLNAWTRRAWNSVPERQGGRRTQGMMGQEVGRWRGLARRPSCGQLSIRKHVAHCIQTSLAFMVIQSKDEGENFLLTFYIYVI